MPQTNVASCVLSIIASFTSGKDVFQNFKNSCDGSKRKVKKAVKAPREEEVRLARSLQQGPEDIGREYRRNVQTLGDEFAVGDIIAQSTLAEVLLKLNTGLVDIIHVFLNRSKKDAQLDYRSLTALSDDCRVDTCRTLRQLCKRMLQMRTPARNPLPEQDHHEASRSSTSVHETSKTRKKSTASKHTKIRGPILARVVIENSKKASQIALVKPGERKKRSGRSTVATKSSSSTSSPALVKTESTPQLNELVTETPAHYVATRPMRPIPKDPSSTRNINERALKPTPVTRVHRAAYSTPDLGTVVNRNEESVPAMPTPRPTPRWREPTPTVYSIASGSTRLGEIPLHKWPEPYDFDAMSMLNREAARNGWPVANLDAPRGGTRKRFGIWRIFGRSGTR